MSAGIQSDTPPQLDHASTAPPGLPVLVLWINCKQVSIIDTLGFDFLRWARTIRWASFLGRMWQHICDLSALRLLLLLLKSLGRHSLFPMRFWGHNCDGLLDRIDPLGIGWGFNLFSAVFTRLIADHSWAAAGIFIAVTPT